ncbi:alpha/beta fold hydrolase [Dactylosporangium sp. CS-033363]|uniref:alpha/beta fold hydrolase n=1 Tax=Dactylosporangium sp. CS-033363 TaxID=3239935 RepID=UPI003D8DA8C6
MTGYTTATVHSVDGTRIGYRQYGGNGPGLVLLHGGMKAAQHFSTLAATLSDAFTVYVPDRRGRGRSGPHGAGHGMAREIEDLQALLAATGTELVFGLSIGGLIALRTALAASAVESAGSAEFAAAPAPAPASAATPTPAATPAAAPAPTPAATPAAAPAPTPAAMPAPTPASAPAAASAPAIRRLAVYEPPLSINGSIPTAWLARYDRELSAGHRAAALITAMRGLPVEPIFHRVPRAALTPLLALGLRAQKAGPDETTIADLIPTQGHDVRLAEELADTVEDYAALRARVLLLGGTRGPSFFEPALAALEAAIPDARRITFPGLTHEGPEDDGRPLIVAAALRDFFSAR